MARVVGGCEQRAGVAVTAAHGGSGWEPRGVQAGGSRGRRGEGGTGGMSSRGLVARISL